MRASRILAVVPYLAIWIGVALLFALLPLQWAVLVVALIAMLMLATTLSYDPNVVCNCQICGMKSVIPRHRTLDDCAKARCPCCTTVTGFIQSMRYLRREGLLKTSPRSRKKIGTQLFRAILVIVSGVALALVLRWLGLG